MNDRSPVNPPPNLSSLYVFSHSLTISNVSLCHSRFSLSVIPDNKTWIPANYCGEESRVLCQTDPHA